MSLPVPNFVIMGAQKSGTTSLHEYLKVHPDIFMSSPLKEPGYFLGDEVVPRFWKIRGLEVASREDLLARHMLQGYRGQRLFGDSSTYYTIGRRSRREAVPQRMAQVNPGMKFIYMLRDPIDRIRSNYLHSLRRGSTNGSIREFLGQPEGRIAVMTSLYHFQLEAFLEHFDASQFHVLVFEEFLQNPARHMRNIFEFLGAADIPIRIKFGAHNVSHNRAESEVTSKLDLSADLLDDLRGRLVPDVKRLSSHIGREIAAWTLGRSA